MASGNMMDNRSRNLYVELKKILSSINVTPIVMEHLKNHFQNDIASRRLRERIRSVEELLDALERHDAISEYDVSKLSILLNYCADTISKDIFNRYTPPTNVEYTNQYREIRLADTLREHLHTRGINNFQTCAVTQTPNASPVVASFAGVFTDEKRKAVYKKLSKELGTFWRNFGRELDISEGDMDNIELQFPRDLPSRIYKLMQIFEEDDSHDPKKHVIIICRALDKSRRKDLRRKIEDIMSF